MTSTTDMIGPAILVILCLVLAISGLRSRQLSTQRTVLFLGTWLAIIVAVIVVIRLFGITVE